MASLASCSDELKENVSMNVGVQTEEGVTVQGNEVTVKILTTSHSGVVRKVAHMPTKTVL